METSPNQRRYMLLAEDMTPRPPPVGGEGDDAAFFIELQHFDQGIIIDPDDPFSPHTTDMVDYGGPRIGGMQSADALDTLDAIGPLNAIDGLDALDVLDALDASEVCEALSPDYCHQLVIPSVDVVMIPPSESDEDEIDVVSPEDGPLVSPPTAGGFMRYDVDSLREAIEFGQRRRHRHRRRSAGRRWRPHSSDAGTAGSDCSTAGADSDISGMVGVSTDDTRPTSRASSSGPTSRASTSGPTSRASSSVPTSRASSSSRPSQDETYGPRSPATTLERSPLYA